ncbi:hypothetical protein BpHYR1_040295 [Brachionus plicatilis]|uniref:Uncharacterized protein n=1 Tax=Brachionus plicatilis TaxID=10195 RepID=A0A3M7PML8_BRAPC|nr:hypothetical protein BpHYR1_040295 [Brachionus plicatilis]
MLLINTPRNTSKIFIILLAQARCLVARYLVSDNDELEEVSEEAFNGWMEEVTSSQGAKKCPTKQKEFKEREEELRTMAEELNELKKLKLGFSKKDGTNNNSQTGNHESKLSPPLGENSSNNSTERSTDHKIILHPLS